MTWVQLRMAARLGRVLYLHRAILMMLVANLLPVQDGVRNRLAARQALAGKGQALRAQCKDEDEMDEAATHGKNCSIGPPQSRA